MGLKIHMTSQPIVPTLLKPNTSAPCLSPTPPIQLVSLKGPSGYKKT